MNFSDEQIDYISKLFFDSIKQLNKEERLDDCQVPEFKKNYVKPLYPHTIGQNGAQKYSCSEACYASPGYFCCCASKQTGKEFVKLGLSVCIYFKFIKHTIAFYLFLSVLAILSCVVCFQVALQNNVKPYDGYSNFLFSTTYGAFASEHNKCQYSLLNSTFGVYSASFHVKCLSGTVNVFSPVLSSESLNSLYNCRNERKKHEHGDASTNASRYLLTSRKSCNSNQSECTISQTYSPLVEKTGHTTVAYTYQCLSNYYKIGTLNLESADYLYFVVAVDLFFCVWFMVFLFSEVLAENYQTNNFKKQQLSLDQFSIKIKGFTTKTADQEFQSLINALIEKNKDKDIIKSIVSYTFHENEENDQFQIFSKIIKLVKKYYFDDESYLDQTFEDCTKAIKDKQEGKLYNKYKKELSDLIDKMIKPDDSGFKEKTPLLLVFDEVDKKCLFKNILQKRCCSNNEIVLGENRYQTALPPLPDMIIWKNKYRWTKVRVFISWVFTLIICLGSYLLFGYIQYKQSQLFTQYNYGIDCNVLYTSAQLSKVNTTLLSQENYVTCICKDQSLLSFSSQNDSYCSTWMAQYRLYLIVPLLISLGIVFYNIIVSYIFHAMRQFEKHKFLIDEQLSYTLKRAFLLVMNMGLVMILLNLNYNNSINLMEVSFIFLGKYDDFSADWYQNIGAILILTMIFNISTPIVEFFLSFLWRCFRRNWNTPCKSMNTQVKTKSQYLKLYSNDIFPIGERYAYLIATFFITFSFSGVIPILVPISALTFVLLYFCDKILVFKSYQTPKNYPLTLHRLLINMIILSLISHFCLTSYFLTESSMIATNSNIYSPEEQIVPNSRINSMITTIYIYPYLGLLTLTLLYVLTSFFWDSLVALCDKCSGKQSDKATESSPTNPDKNLWKIFSTLQLKNLLKISEYNLTRYELKQQKQDLKTLLSSLEHKSQQEKDKEKATNASQILQNIVKVLQEQLQKRQKEVDSKREVEDNNMYSLLGSPSYDLFIQKDKLLENNLMVKIQLELRKYFKRSEREIRKSRLASSIKARLSIGQTAEATQLFETKRNDTETNLNAETM